MARQCEFFWEFRGLPHTPQDAALNKFQAVSAALAAERFGEFPNAKIETFVEIEAPGLAAGADSSASTLALALSRANHTIAVPYATEAGQFQFGGLPAVICGPAASTRRTSPTNISTSGRWPKASPSCGGWRASFRAECRQGYSARIPSEPIKASRTMLVAPGVPNGTPATMMMRSPGAGEALDARRICRRDSAMSSTSSRVLGDDRMHAPDERRRPRRARDWA